METLTKNADPNTNLNFNYRAFDEFLSTKISSQELDEMFEEVEVELLTSPVDYVGDEPDLDVRGLCQLFNLLRELQPIKS